jgi:hypothetical protein
MEAKPTGQGGPGGPLGPPKLARMLRASARYRGFERKGVRLLGYNIMVNVMDRTDIKVPTT